MAKVFSTWGEVVDYFAAEPETAFYHCGSSMMLAVEESTLREVTP